MASACPNRKPRTATRATVTTLHHLNNLTTRTLDFVKLRQTAKAPTKGSQKAAGYDLYAAEEATVSN
jgi:hypothetical protein